MPELLSLGLAVFPVVHVGLLVGVSDEPGVAVIVYLYDWRVGSLVVILRGGSGHKHLTADIYHFAPTKTTFSWY